MTPEGVGNFGIDSLMVDGKAVLQLSGDSGDERDLRDHLTGRGRGDD